MVLLVSFTVVPVILKRDELYWKIHTFISVLWNIYYISLIKNIQYVNVIGGIRMCLDTYYDNSSVRQQNCFLLHKVIT